MSYYINGEIATLGRAGNWLVNMDDIKTAVHQEMRRLEDVVGEDDIVLSAECPYTGRPMGTVVAKDVTPAIRVAYQLLSGNWVDMTEEDARLGDVRQLLPEDFKYQSIPHRTKLGAYKHFWLRPEPAQEPDETPEEGDDLPF